MKKKPELLAPAGDLKRLKIAFLYGADAVYIGGSMFGLRANAANFSLEEIKKGVEFAHKRKKLVYVTVNIACHNKELKEISTYLKELKKCNVDAIIISDLAILNIALEIGLEVHLSTQQSALNKKSIELYKSLGISRIVTAREASKNDIKDIIDNVDIEIETFIHGAMCASYSGRCVLSNYLTARDANRGGCSQICRWDFDLTDNNENELKGDKSFTFCTKDLSMLKVLPSMIDLGISSFKIEGRMRSVYYIATVIWVYRKAIDEYISNHNNYKYESKWETILSNCANRESTVQFFDDSMDESTQYYNGREEISNQEFLGIVKSQEKDLIFLEQRNYFKVGDKVEFFTPDGKSYSHIIEEIYDENMEKIKIANRPKMLVYLKFNHKLPKYSMMRIKKD